MYLQAQTFMTSILQLKQLITLNMQPEAIWFTGDVVTLTAELHVSVSMVTACQVTTELHVILDHLHFTLARASTNFRFAFFITFLLMLFLHKIFTPIIHRSFSHVGVSTNSSDVVALDLGKEKKKIKMI